MSRVACDQTAMKCQQCEKPATFHITELTGGKPQELHLCEEHARRVPDPVRREPTAALSMAAALAHRWPNRWLGQTAEELARLDQQACPVCGITFYEFRNQGRLGCPHDYVCFDKRTGAADRQHPRRDRARGQTSGRPAAGSDDRRTELIRLRREMKEAVDRALRAGLRTARPRFAASRRDGGNDGSTAVDLSGHRIGVMDLDRTIESTHRTMRRMASRFRPRVRHRHQQPHPAGPQPGRLSLHQPGTDQDRDQIEKTA